MTKSERLLALLQVLRSRRHPVSGASLAAELRISLRTLYRDIAVLQAQGACIHGEPGLGYVLRPGYLLPPLMFQEEELEALVLGMRWVARRGDDRLARAAVDALAKIAHVLPADRAETMAGVGLMAVPASAARPPVDVALIRQAIRMERKITIDYGDAGGNQTTRIVWPVLLGYFDHVLVLAAWCEMRQDFRHFRIDRMQDATLLDEAPPRRRRTLLKAWRESQNIGPGAV